MQIIFILLETEDLQDAIEEMQIKANLAIWFIVLPSQVAAKAPSLIHAFRFPLSFVLPLKLSSRLIFFSARNRHIFHMISENHHSFWQAHRVQRGLPFYPAIISSLPQLTLQLGLGNFPAWLGCRDGGSAGRIHERSLQYPGPVLPPRHQVTLPPVLELVLAFPWSKRRNRISTFQRTIKGENLVK